MGPGLLPLLALLLGRGAQATPAQDKHHEREDPGVAYEELVIIGAIDEPEATRVWEEAAPSLASCRPEPQWTGQLVLKLMVDRSGAVESARVIRTTHPSPELEACVLKQVRSLGFPSPSGSGIAIVRQSVSFRSSTGATCTDGSHPAPTTGPSGLPGCCLDGQQWDVALRTCVGWPTPCPEGSLSLPGGDDASCLDPGEADSLRVLDPDHPPERSEGLAIRITQAYGGLDAVGLLLQLDTAAPELRALQARSPGLGAVRVRVVVAPGGTVTAAEVILDGTGNKQLAEGVAQLLSTLRPSVDSGGPWGLAEVELLFTP